MSDSTNLKISSNSEPCKATSIAELKFKALKPEIFPVFRADVERALTDGFAVIRKETSKNKPKLIIDAAYLIPSMHMYYGTSLKNIIREFLKVLDNNNTSAYSPADIASVNAIMLLEKIDKAASDFEKYLQFTTSENREKDNFTVVTVDTDLATQNLENIIGLSYIGTARIGSFIRAADHIAYLEREKATVDAKRSFLFRSAFHDLHETLSDSLAEAQNAYCDYAEVYDNLSALDMMRHNDSQPERKR